jgi:urea transport system substrate-binding protein
VLPVFEELNGLLFYPGAVRGRGVVANVFYTGAAPNQQAIPAVDYLKDELGVERWVLAGTDYVYPRTTNKILEAYLKQNGRRRRRHHDQLHAVRSLRLAVHRRRHQEVRLRGQEDRVVSTINGDANVPFYKELGNQGISAEDIPVVAFSVGEEELSGIDTKPLVGHLAAWNYFMSVDTPENEAFIETWHGLHRGRRGRVTNDPMEAHKIGFDMWVKAVEKAGTTDPDAGHRRHRRPGDRSEPHRRHRQDAAEPPHHQAGADRRDPGRRQFAVVWETEAEVPGDAWSDYLEGSKDRISCWTLLLPRQARHRAASAITFGVMGVINMAHGEGLRSPSGRHHGPSGHAGCLHDLRGSGVHPPVSAGPV